MTDYGSGIRHRIGNFMYAEGALRRRTVGGVDFIIGIAGAYNAYGLIGPERNGIFVLDDTAKRVVLDRDCEVYSGYNGPSKAQWARLEEIADLDDSTFIHWLVSHPRCRLDAGELLP